MKLIIASVLIAFVAADVSHIVPKNSDQNAQILNQELEVGVDGNYHWAIKTDNGIDAQEQGTLKNPQSENAAQVAEGSAQWTSPEGEVIQIQYVADENGFQPQGSHLPTPPPIPAAILRALEYIRAHPPAEEPRS